MSATLRDNFQAHLLPKVTNNVGSTIGFADTVFVTFGDGLIFAVSS